MSKIKPCLWYTGQAEEAARFYVSLMPDSRIDHIQKNVVDTPGGKAGTVLLVEFTLGGQRFMALNGGPGPQHSYAISFAIECADQAEIDRLWAAMTADGGKEVQCGWLTDRYGISWQIVPKALPKLIGDPDPAKAARVMAALLEMVKLDIAELERAYEGRPAA
jgi:predicted 3-demethylubiquinone-9 3-methyltransferase (glyoxalase superfamily)